MKRYVNLAILNLGLYGLLSCNDESLALKMHSTADPLHRIIWGSELRGKKLSEAKDQHMLLYRYECCMKDYLKAFYEKNSICKREGLQIEDIKSLFPIKPLDDSQITWVKEEEIKYFVDILKFFYSLDIKPERKERVLKFLSQLNLMRLNKFVKAFILIPHHFDSRLKDGMRAEFRVNLNHFIDIYNSLINVEDILDINLLDIGGGKGTFSCLLKILFPALRVTIVDLDEKDYLEHEKFLQELIYNGLFLKYCNPIVYEKKNIVSYINRENKLFYDIILLYNVLSFINDGDQVRMFRFISEALRVKGALYVTADHRQNCKGKNYRLIDLTNNQHYYLNNDELMNNLDHNMLNSGKYIIVQEFDLEYFVDLFKNNKISIKPALEKETFFVARETFGSCELISMKIKVKEDLRFF